MTRARRRGGLPPVPERTFDPALLPADCLAAMKEHAVEAYPREAAGFVVGDVYEPQANLDPDPHAFEIDHRAFQEARRRGLRAVVHSHPHGPDAPSPEDMEGQQATCVPWGIVVTYGDGAADPFWWGDTVARAPRIGRRFRHGVTDCYATYRDWTADEAGLLLPDPPRQDAWWRAGHDLFMRLHRDYGFEHHPMGERGFEPETGDMVLMSVACPGVVNHCGVYLGELILHHLSNRASRREPLFPWARHVAGYLRHPEVAAALRARRGATGCTGTAA